MDNSEGRVRSRDLTEVADSKVASKGGISEYIRTHKVTVLIIALIIAFIIWWFFIKKKKGVTVNGSVPTLIKGPVNITKSRS